MPQATLKDIEADTVIAEFETDKNQLSIWAIEDETDLDDAFVALCSNCDGICTVAAVKIDPDDVASLLITPEEGDTPTIGINQKHRNISELNYVSMGTVIESMLKGFNNAGFIKKTKKDMRPLIVRAYDEGKLDKDRLSERMKQDIEKARINLAKGA